MLGDKLIVIKGAGDIATAVAHKLFRCGFKVILTEIARPTCVRRNVSFANCIFTDIWRVEEVTAEKAMNIEEALDILEDGNIPVLIDPETNVLKKVKSFVLVDCILAKRNTGTSIMDAELVIALGPGFVAGEDAHVVIETNRGHNLGRIITKGAAEADTGIPGNIEGFSADRILRAPTDGIVSIVKDIGDLVEKDETIALVNGVAAKATIGGVIRGLINDGTEVIKGLKMGDIDPRREETFVDTISDKGRCVAGAVLEAILIKMQVK